jgi:hypothetical protein
MVNELRTCTYSWGEETEAQTNMLIEMDRSFSLVSLGMLLGGRPVLLLCLSLLVSCVC